jgi:methylenetetrahydrofolate--tRNA-(uracil-5-)-methyltransferase
MLGALYRYLAEADARHFQPMNANFGLLEPLPEKSLPRAARGVKKDRKKELLVQRAQTDFARWLEESGIQQEKTIAQMNTDKPGSLRGRTGLRFIP